MSVSNITFPRRLAALYAVAAAIFLSAFLLFSVQPMFTRMVLPILGGAPAVWSVAMVFFQACLLAGYFYAHCLSRYVTTASAALVHVVLMLAAALFLPPAIADGWRDVPTEYPAAWLLGLFAASLGLPFFALAANGPLLQSWYARAGATRSADPYFLYVASNLGSFSALMLYPVAIEPLLALEAQSGWWSAGYAGLVVLIGLAAATSRGAVVVPSAAPLPGLGPYRAPSIGDRAVWAAVAAVPAGLSIAVTAHISTDVAAVPLIWVLPLALYLLSFAAAFRHFGPRACTWLGLGQVISVAGALLLLSVPFPDLLALTAGWHLAALFITAVACHHTLYRRRPATSHVTDFYLWLAAGGVVGGIAAAILAPLLLDTVAEYPLLLALSLLCGPGVFAIGWRRFLRGTTVFSAILAAVLTAWIISAGAMLDLSAQTAAAFAILSLAAVMVIERREMHRAWVAALAIFAMTVAFDRHGEATLLKRSFFGVHSVRDTAGGEYRLLFHGTTLHGAIRISDAAPETPHRRPEPLSYYTLGGTIGSAIAAVREAQGGRLASVTSVGLGAGSLACHAEAGETWRFLEIDPDVVDIAIRSGLFTFLARCTPGAEIVIGDARLTLTGTPPAALIVMDAFSSDAIPLHLLTREAFGLYLDRLVPNGVLVLHVSNRHMELSRILARVAAEHGLVAFYHHDARTEADVAAYRLPSTSVAIARKPEHLGALATDWTRLQPDLARTPWTDDYSNLLEALLDARK
jgi:hypothetical protein